MHSLLFQPIDKLPVIEELNAFMKENNFNNLSELMAYSSEDLLKMEGFGYRSLMSLYKLLKENGYEELLKE